MCDVTDLSEWKKKKAGHVRETPTLDPLLDIAIAVSNQGKVLKEIMGKDRTIVDCLKAMAQCQNRTVEQQERMLNTIESMILRIEAIEKKQQEIMRLGLASDGALNKTPNRDHDVN